MYYLNFTALKTAETTPIAGCFKNSKYASDLK